MASLNPFKPAYAAAEAVSLIGAGAAQFVNWSGPGLGVTKNSLPKTNAFRVPLSQIWTPTHTPDQPRVGQVLLVVAIAGLVLAVLPVMSRLRVVRMAGLLAASGVSVALFAEAARLHQLSALGPGVYLSGALFAAAALFATGFLRLPILFGLAPVILGGFAVLGAVAGARHV